MKKVHDCFNVEYEKSELTKDTPPKEITVLCKGVVICVGRTDLERLILTKVIITKLTDAVEDRSRLVDVDLHIALNGGILNLHSYGWLSPDDLCVLGQLAHLAWRRVFHSEDFI